MQQSIEFEATAEQAETIRERLSRLAYLTNVSVTRAAVDAGFVVDFTSRSDAMRSVRAEIMLIVGDAPAPRSLQHSTA